MSRSGIDYGLDAPGVVLGLFLFGTIATAAGAALLIFGGRFLPVTVATIAGITLFCSGGWPLLTGVVMVWGSRVGKLRVRDRIISRIRWVGDERVLDVGCGHGLMLIGAAHRLTTGTAFGVDLWQTRDQAGNSMQATLENARIEGVESRVSLRDGDARQLPFADASFDVVLSSWALHNIYDAPGRAAAVREIVRVLRPGGRVAIADIRHTHEYARIFREAGMVNVSRGGPNFVFGIPGRVVTAQKPA